MMLELLSAGHTEFIADITGGNPVMMLATPGLRVALVTIHLPLAEVPRGDYAYAVEASNSNPGS